MVYDTEKSNPTKVVPPIFVKKTGVFSLEEVLNIARGWFNEHMYYFTEKEQTEKIKPEGSEIIIEWNSFRKIDGYFRFHINVIVFVLRYLPVEVDEEGKRIRKGKGELEITMKANLDKDYRGKFERYGDFGEFLRVMYERFFIRKRFEKMRSKLQAETYDLHNHIKENLKALHK